MATNIEEKLAEMKREIERQDGVWERTKEQLLALGDEQLLVSDSALGEIGEATAPCVVGTSVPLINRI